MPFTLATWNINSVRLRADLVARLLRGEGPDVLCLQECKSPVDKIPATIFAALGYPHMIARGEKVHTWPYQGYWRDVGTLESYWDAHMDLLSDPPAYDLNDLGWLIHTRSEDRAPARLEDARVVGSLITNGCVIQRGATVERSVLGPGVTVRPGAVVRDSIVLNDVIIGKDAVVERAIIDKHARIGKGARVGEGRADAALAVIGKGSALPDGYIVRPGGEVAHDVAASDYDGPEVPSGLCLHTKRRPWEIGWDPQGR